MGLKPEIKKYFQAEYPHWKEASVEAVLDIYNKDNVYYAAHYQKDRVAGLGLWQILKIIRAIRRFEALEEKKKLIFKDIEARQVDVPESEKNQIKECYKMSELEERYRPYRKKKSVKTGLAKEEGLDKLADYIWKWGHGELEDKALLEMKAKEFISKSFPTYEDVLKESQKLIIQRVLQNKELRKGVVDKFFQKGQISVTAGKKLNDKSRYKHLKGFQGRISQIKNSNQWQKYLSICRGWHEGHLKVSIEAEKEEELQRFKDYVCPKKNLPVTDFLENCGAVCFSNHILPSASHTVHDSLKEWAEERALEQLIRDSQQLLMRPPFGDQVLLSILPKSDRLAQMALVGAKGEFVSSTFLRLGSGEEREAVKKTFF